MNTVCYQKFEKKCSISFVQGQHKYLLMLLRQSTPIHSQWVGLSCKKMVCGIDWNILVKESGDPVSINRNNSEMNEILNNLYNNTIDRHVGGI